MAKLDKALVYETRDYRFESCRVRHISRHASPPRGFCEGMAGQPVRERVFAFLGLLVAACAVLAHAVRGRRVVPVAAEDDDEMVAAVTAAIRHHRRVRAAGPG